MKESKSLLSEEYINSLINRSKVETEILNGRGVLMQLTLPNGYIIAKTSFSVSEDNFSEEIGKDICEKKIADELWMLETYAALPSNR